ncbi:hypothetical protein COPG_00051 [Colwellia phage 9A]|uniref:Uncharacterized protein n=1 Tax=Colwellia phage 9A TaxID=765765 RepID=I3UMD2_9CAUD|nr:hypothetical protein COPG_00051 [Colwellia phage 9A]AFK66647.1 hypothetical protein COPG_00051 [Colwellia phage 9A]
MQNTNYSHRKSSQAGKVPAPELLRVGEIAVNLTDKKIFSKDEDGRVISFFDNDTTAENTFLMEDAADAKRTILGDGGSVGLDPEGYSYNISADSTISVAEIRYSTGGNLWQLSVTDINAKTFPTELINGKKVDVEYDGVPLGRFTISATANGSTLVNLDWTGLDVDPNTVNTVKFTPVAAVYKDFEANEAWVNDGTNFRPIKVVLPAPNDGKQYVWQNDDWAEVVITSGGGGKMEDADDAELLPTGYTVATYATSTTWDSSPLAKKFAAVSDNGVTVNLQEYVGKSMDVSIDGGLTYTTVIFFDSATPTENVVGWVGMPSSGALSIKVPLATTIPLKKNDAWVHDGSKFVPQEIVPTLVVTSFPTDPLPNTLYIKVGG